MRISDFTSGDRVVLIKCDLMVIIEQYHPTPLHHISKIGANPMQLKNINKKVSNARVEVTRVALDVVSRHSEQSSYPMGHHWRTIRGH